MGQIVVEMDGKEKIVEFKGSKIRADRLLERFNIFPETAVVLRNGELLCDDDFISDGERVKVVVALSKG